MSFYQSKEQQGIAHWNIKMTEELLKVCEKHPLGAIYDSKDAVLWLSEVRQLFPKKNKKEYLRFVKEFVDKYSELYVSEFSDEADMLLDILISFLEVLKKFKKYFSDKEEMKEFLKAYMVYMAEKMLEKEDLLFDAYRSQLTPHSGYGFTSVT